jgi:hypothetical protein
LSFRNRDFSPFNFSLYDYDSFVARRRWWVLARRRSIPLRAFAGDGAAPGQPDPPAGGDLVSPFACDPAGRLQLAQTALDVSG